MHDIDRTQLEYGQEMSGFEMEQFEFGNNEWSGESGLFSEAEEMEFANELLGVSNEEELDQFLGDFIRKAASAAGKAIRSPAGQAIGGMLKGVAKKALPIAGGALGAYFGGPLGAKIGSGLANAAGSALGLEGEMLEQEDHEFEGAKQFVRLAADAVNKTIATPTNTNPVAAAQAAIQSATQQFAPGLLGQQKPRSPAHRNSGRWVRQGNKIFLHGV